LVHVVEVLASARVAYDDSMNDRVLLGQVPADANLKFIQHRLVELHAALKVGEPSK
jgi:hypothetical protein